MVGLQGMERKGLLVLLRLLGGVEEMLGLLWAGKDE